MKRSETAGTAVLIERLTLTAFRSLGAYRSVAITLLLSGDRAPLQGRVERAARRLEARLRLLGRDHQEVARFKAALLALSGWLNDYETSAEGLAIFLDDGACRLFAIPANVKENVITATHFHIRPLLNWLLEPSDFLILDMSGPQVRLIRCCDRQIRELPLPDGVPASLSELAAFDASPYGEQRKFTRKTGRYSPAISCRLAAADEQRRAEFFCAALDRGLCSMLEELALPLLLAGPRRLTHLYRKQNTYPKLVIEGLHGKLDSRQPLEIVRRAGRMIASSYAMEAKRHLAEMEGYAPGDRWSDSVEEILKAAVEGRVWRLFLAADARVRGDFAAMTAGREPLSSGALDEDLLNAAAAETLAHGGEVFPMAANELPFQAPAAALFRYSPGVEREDQA